MRKLYVLSKPLGNKPRLIGELTEENGEYAFEYKLGGTFPEWFLEIDEFPDPKRKYVGNEVRPFIERIIPKPNSAYISRFLKSADILSYDEWELLKYCGKFSPQEDAFLYEKLPERVVSYGF
jgi:hypothetical protein